MKTPHPEPVQLASNRLALQSEPLCDRGAGETMFPPQPRDFRDRRIGQPIGDPRGRRSSVVQGRGATPVMALEPFETARTLTPTASAISPGGQPASKRAAINSRICGEFWHSGGRSRGRSGKRVGLAAASFPQLASVNNLLRIHS